MLVGLDSGNVQAQYDLAIAYTEMGDSFRLTNLEMAGAWYRKSISLTKKLAPLYGAGARHWLAIMDEALAEVLEEKSKRQSGCGCCWKQIRSAANWQKPVHMAAFT